MKAGGESAVKALKSLPLPPPTSQAPAAETRDLRQRRRLQRMQRAALALLLAMAALYVLAVSFRHLHPAWNYVVAFAEAAMVGAVADWFAVVALFRHPLGIPIWHTAIIPDSKDDIGRNLGEFVESHFVTVDAVARRLRAADPASLLSAWLLAPHSAPKVGHALTQVADKLLEALDDHAMQRLLREVASRQLGRFDVSASAGKVVDSLVSERRHQNLLDGSLQGAADYLSDEANHPQIRDFLIDAFNVDNLILKTALKAYAPRAIASLHQAVITIRDDEEHPVRRKFDVWVRDSVVRLKSDPGWQDRIARLQQETLASPQAEALLDSLWGVIKLRLQADIARDDPVIATQFALLASKAGEALDTDVELRAWLNQAILSGSAGLIRKYRGEVRKFIQAQLAQWTQNEMSQRIELAIGRELQFIRINGTVVGGLAGVAIYALTQWLAPG